MSFKKLLFLFLIFLSTSSIAQERRMPPATVEVAQVENTQLATSTKIPGTVSSQQYAWHSAETTGKILSLKAIGTTVKKGDTLAVLNTKILRSQRKEQESNVKSEESQILYLRNQVKRLHELRAQNIAAESQIEETQALLDRAINNKAASESRLQQINIGIAASTLRAQFAGTITEHAMQAGEFASPGRQIVRVINLNSKEIIARTALSNIPFLKVGDTVNLSRASKTGNAKLIALVPVGDTTEGVYELRMQILQGKWLVGEKLSVAIPQSEDAQKITVPRDAIILRAEGNSVIKVATDNSTQRIQVNTGIGNGERIVVSPINGELNVGDQVIIRGAESLRDGQSIKIKNN